LIRIIFSKEISKAIGGADHTAEHTGFKNIPTIFGEGVGTPDGITLTV
jgi:hypothetical protein